MSVLDADMQLQQLREENEALRAELEETNQGVLALYAELDQQAEQLKARLLVSEISAVQLFEPAA